MHKFKLILLMTISICLITACSDYYGADPNDSKEFPNEEKTNPNRIHHINNDPNKDYLQSDEEGIAPDGIENNFFETDEAREISQHLARKKEVKQYYVAPFDDRVVITVQFREYTNVEDKGKQLQDEIKKLTPNKNVIVYTDEYSWNQMNQIKAGNVQREAGESAEEFIERIFNVNIKK